MVDTSITDRPKSIITIAVIPAGHVDAMARFNRASVFLVGAFIHVVAARWSCVTETAETSVRSNAFAAVLASSVANGCKMKFILIRPQIKKFIPQELGLKLGNQTRAAIY